MPGIGGTQGRGDRVVVHHVGVGLTPGSVAGMKICCDIFRLTHHNIIGEQTIGPAHQGC